MKPETLNKTLHLTGGVVSGWEPNFVLEGLRDSRRVAELLSLAHSLTHSLMSRLIPVIAAAITAAVLVGCRQTHSVSMKVTQDDKDPVFHFQMQGINGLQGLRIWRIDTKEVLWDVSLNHYRGSRLSYGEIPTEIRTGGTRASQQYPMRSQRPQPLPLSTTFMVQLVAQYDVPFAPSGQAYYFLFSTDANGALSGVTIPQRITADDLPRPKGEG